MQEIVDKLNLRSMFDTEEVRDKLKMAGLRGQAPLVDLHVLPGGDAHHHRLRRRSIYLFLVADYDYPPLVKIGLCDRRRLRRLLYAQHVHPEPGAAPPDLHQERVSRRASTCC